MKKYIIAVLVLFGFLLLSRIPAFLDGTASGETIISSFVEYAFLVWGILVLRKNKKGDGKQE